MGWHRAGLCMCIKHPGGWGFQAKEWHFVPSRCVTSATSAHWRGQQGMALWVPCCGRHVEATAT